MSSYPIQEGQRRAPRFPSRAVELTEWRGLLLKRLRGALANPSQPAAVAMKSAVLDASCRDHRGAGGEDDVSDPKVRLTARDSRVVRPERIQPDQPIHDSNPIRPLRPAAQGLVHDVGSLGLLPARLQNKPAAVAPAQRLRPLQTFYVVLVCPASIYACVAL